MSDPSDIDAQESESDSEVLEVDADDEDEVHDEVDEKYFVDFSS